MGLLQILKSVFGLNGTEPSSGRSAGDVDVTVEREPSTDDEDAVKGTDTASTNAETTDETESPVSEAEPETDDGSSSAHEPTDESPVEEAEPGTNDTADAVAGSDDSVTELNGIGPAYAERLSNVGIETVGELAAADAAEIDAETDLSEKRVADWIEQAIDY